MKRAVLVVLVMFALCFVALLPVLPDRTGPAMIEAQPKVIMVTLDPSLAQFEEGWRIEIERRFTNAVGILVHGGDPLQGQWIVGAGFQPWDHVSTAYEVVTRYQKLYPGRTIVFLACNTGHLKLGIPGVYYAHSSVWCIPDRGLKPEHFSSFEATRVIDDWMFPRIGDTGFRFRALDDRPRWIQRPEVVGNIYEFNCE